jgi:hypothetical protein
MISAEELGITAAISNGMSEVLTFGALFHRMCRDAILAVDRHVEAMLKSTTGT